MEGREEREAAGYKCGSRGQIMKSLVNSCKDFIFYLEVGGNIRGFQVI